jgi:hypothetical protein
VDINCDVDERELFIRHDVSDRTAFERHAEFFGRGRLVSERREGKLFGAVWDGVGRGGERRITNDK